MDLITITHKKLDWWCSAVD